MKIRIILKNITLVSLKIIFWFMLIAVVTNIDQFYELWKYSGEDRYSLLKEGIAADPESHKYTFSDGTYLYLCTHSSSLQFYGADFEVLKTTSGNWYEIEGVYMDHALRITRYIKKSAGEKGLDKELFLRTIEKMIKERNLNIRLRERGGRILNPAPHWKGELPDEWKTL